jgi:hypothetical protein
MSLNIYNEHVVSSFGDFKSNYCQIQQLKSFLSVGCEKRIFIISGILASGKTTLLDLIKNNNDYESILLTFDIDYHVQMNNYCSKKTICQFFEIKPKLILIDDIHLFDKSIINYLKNVKNIKIVITVQSKEESRIVDLRTTVMSEKVSYIKLNKISFQDCFIVVSDLISKLNLQDELSDKSSMKTIKESNCNIRHILQQLSKVKIGNDESKPLLQEVKMIGNIHDMNIYQIAQYFLKNRIDDDFLNLNFYGMTNYLIYENFIQLFVSKSKNKISTLEIYKYFLENTALINTDILQHENYEAYSYLEYYTTHKNNLLLLTQSCQDISLKFSSIFNKLSTQSSFNKKCNHTINTNKIFNPYIRAMCVKDPAVDYINKKMITDFMH